MVRKQFLSKDHSEWIYVFAPDGKPSFFDECLRKDPDRAVRISKTVKRVSEFGLEWAFDSQTIKPIRGTTEDVAVFETRVKGRVIRVATYIHERHEPVYLFDFDTHAGSGNNLPDVIKERAVQRCKLVADYLNSHGLEG